MPFSEQLFHVASESSSFMLRLVMYKTQMLRLPYLFRFIKISPFYNSRNLAENMNVVKTLNNNHSLYQTIVCNSIKLINLRTAGEGDEYR